MTKYIFLCILLVEGGRGKMKKIVKRKAFKHGGGYAISLPVEYIRATGATKFIEEIDGNTIKIRPEQALDNIEIEPLFGTFIQALVIDAMKNPKKLHEAKEVWDKEWDELLDGVIDDEKE